MRSSDWSSDVCSSDLRAGLLKRLDVGIAALDAVELAVVVDRAVAGPELAHHVQIFAGAAVAVVLGQEVALAGLVRVAGAGDDMQRSDERRVGTECVSTGRTRWSADN